MKTATRAKKPSRNGKAKKAAPAPPPQPVYPTFDDPLGETCRDLQRIQKLRATVIKLRLRQENSARALVAVELGYYAGMPEKERKALHKMAQSAVDRIRKGGGNEVKVWKVVKAILTGNAEYESLQSEYEKDMVGLAKKFPAKVLEWAARPERKGFSSGSLLQLAIVIGETGDLRSYSNPAKFWRRMICAPFANERGETHMGATWRSLKGLSADEWNRYHYNKRRRSVAYLVGQGLMMQNFMKPVGAGDDSAPETERQAVPGPYRTRYEEARTKAKAKHPDWPDMHLKLHGMLLATKLLLKDLFVVWNDRPLVDPRWGV